MVGGGDGGGGVRATRDVCDWPSNQGALDGPQPPGLDEPLLTARESPGHTLRWRFREANCRLSKERRWAWDDERTGRLRPDRAGLRPGNWVYTLGGGRGDPLKGLFMMSRMTRLTFGACATVGRAGASKYLFLAHMWALLGLGRIVMAGRGGGGTAAWEPDWNQILGLGGYNQDTANKGGYGGKVTGMPRREVKRSSARQRAGRMVVRQGDTSSGDSALAR